MPPSWSLPLLPAVTQLDPQSYVTHTRSWRPSLSRAHQGVNLVRVHEARRDEADQLACHRPAGRHGSKAEEPAARQEGRQRLGLPLAARSPTRPPHVGCSSARDLELLLMHLALRLHTGLLLLADAHRSADVVALVKNKSS